MHRAHALLSGHRCQLLKDGVEAFPAMLSSIRGARRRIRLETYMFIDDSVGELFAKALVEAAARGVRVTVLYDAMGSIWTRQRFFRALRTHGVDARAFNPFSLRSGLRRLMRRDHRKLLVVDGEVAYIGGVNIAAHWAPKGQGGGWRDDVLRIEGPAVQQLERHFCASWSLQAKRRLREWRRRRPAWAAWPQKGTVALGVLSSRRSIHRAYVRAIDRAKSSVFIASGYFLPDRAVLGAIKAAAQRGVDVSLLLPARSDHQPIVYASRRLYERLLGWGVKIFEWHQGVLHAKTAVIDGTWGTMGSFNLERLSLLWNHEMNVVFADPGMAQALERSFKDDCAECTRVDLARFRARPFWQKVLERLCFVFRKLM